MVRLEPRIEFRLGITDLAFRTVEVWEMPYELCS